MTDIIKFFPDPSRVIDFEIVECKPEEVKGLPVCSKPSEKDLEIWKKGEQ